MVQVIKKTRWSKPYVCASANDVMAAASAYAAFPESKQDAIVRRAYDSFCTLVNNLTPAEADEILVSDALPLFPVNRRSAEWVVSLLFLAVNIGKDNPVFLEEFDGHQYDTLEVFIHGVDSNGYPA